MGVTLGRVLWVRMRLWGVYRRKGKALRVERESFIGENEAWDSPREERWGSTGRSEAWEGPREETESSTGASEA